MLTACTSQVKVPDHLLTEVEMGHILMDVHLLESKINALRISVDSSKIVYDHFKDEIFEDHQVDSAHYYESMAFYMDHPEMLERIYNVVIDSLMLRDQNKDID